MTEPDNKAIIRQYLEEIVNTGSVEKLSEFVAEDAVDHNFGTDTPQGLEGFKQHLLAVHTTYGNFHITIEDQIADGDMVVTRVTARGIHKSEWLGLPPSLKEIVIPGINIDRLKSGKIIEHWGEANTIGALFQMGAKIVP